VMFFLPLRRSAEGKVLCLGAGCPRPSPQPAAEGGAKDKDMNR
jgi:hypothetical protein